ncbi:MAG: hypothetical protein DRJ31_05995 [Candidatus Methanomethylicota archaeon]|uniref:NADH-quinone oxidoreductase subunit D domain-containing protein n=1 Tax=Thermoproteota archaeon TaxID=2056631 RepID=A0A497EP67_9CREN|nr:MAG: hypothetical protein DRJ31_05995 [Candidatus Verstraetearchaeota archaeon]
MQAPNKNQQVVEKELPIGPVHPALLEPFRIRFFVNDEIVEDCEVVLGTIHRGVERILEGQPVERALLITERVCGICSNSHAWNSVRVVERGLNIEIPPRAMYIRVIAQEVQRIASHLIFLGHAMEVIGHETFAMRAFLLRESFMDILYYIGGNRVHPSVPVIGGVRPRCEITEGLKKLILELLDRGEKMFKAYVERVLADPLVMSRVTGTGYLSKEDAIRLHAVGPTARASNVRFDWRMEMDEYKPFTFDYIFLEDGDNKARVVARALEIFECIKIVRQALKDLPEGPLVNRNWVPKRMKFTDSYNEAPRGELYHSYALDDYGRLRHYKIRTPTITSLHAVEYAAIGDHVTDAVLTIASADPCLSCCQRVEVVDVKSKKCKMFSSPIEVVKKYGWKR